MSLDTEFTEAAEKIKTLKKKPTDLELLQLYGLFKQATIGDVDTARPGMFDMKAKYKWDAWDARKGMSQDEAKKEYIALVATLVVEHGV